MPYLAEQTHFLNEIMDLWSCPTLPETVASQNLLRMAKESELSSDSDSGDHEDDEANLVNVNPADTFLTGKAVQSEIKLKDLSSEDRAK